MNSRLEYIVGLIDSYVSVNFYVKDTKFHGICRQELKNGKKVPVSYTGNGNFKFAGFDDKNALNIYHRIISNPNISTDSATGFGTSKMITEETTLRMVVFGATQKTKTTKNEINYQYSEDISSLIPLELTPTQRTTIQAQGVFIELQGKEVDKRVLWESELDSEYSGTGGVILFAIDYKVKIKYLDSCRTLSCSTTLIPNIVCGSVRIIDQDGNVIATVDCGDTYSVLVFSGINDTGPPYTNSIVEP